MPLRFILHLSSEVATISATESEILCELCTKNMIPQWYHIPIVLAMIRSRELTSLVTLWKHMPRTYDYLNPAVFKTYDSLIEAVGSLSCEYLMQFLEIFSRTPYEKFWYAWVLFAAGGPDSYLVLYDVIAKLHDELKINTFEPYVTPSLGFVVKSHEKWPEISAAKRELYFKWGIPRETFDEFTR